jgi:hypothetical protein
MAKYLVTFNDQINDIEIYGFKTMTEKEVENFERLAESITWGITEDVLEQITKEDEDYIDDLDDLDEDNDYNDKDYRDTDFYSDDDDF